MEIDFPRYSMKYSGENVILRGIFHVVSGFPLHLMILYIAEIWITFRTVCILASIRLLWQPVLLNYNSEVYNPGVRVCHRRRMYTEEKAKVVAAV